jgi:hypothetical protein
MKTIDFPSLALALTEDVWSDRQLQVSKDVQIKIRTVWMGSGNNTEFSKELQRRIVPIPIQPREENPSERNKWRCAPLTLEEWAAKHRRQLLTHCLTICQNWIAEGCPKGTKTMGSYEVYARVMGGILESAGIIGFLDNLKTVSSKTSDRESMRWRALVSAWVKAYPSKPVTAGEVFDLIFGVGADVGIPDLQVAFSDIIGEGSVLSRKQRLGHALAKQVDRIWADRRITLSSVKSRGSSPTYQLSDPTDTEDAGPFSSE